MKEEEENEGKVQDDKTSGDDGPRVDVSASEVREKGRKHAEPREKRMRESREDEGMKVGQAVGEQDEDDQSRKRVRRTGEEAQDDDVENDDGMDTDIVMEIRRVQQQFGAGRVRHTGRETFTAPDIAEVYSPPRVAEEGKRWGLEPGESMDLTTGWDFRKREQRDRAWKYVREKEPKLLIGSPMCRMFSQLQALSPWTKEKQERWFEAVEHVKFVVALYRLQMRAGRLFLHEHPAGASSWSLNAVKELLEEEGVMTTVADQCQYGLETKTQDGKGTAPARKRTRFVTNSWGISEELNKKCDGAHVHAHLIGEKRAEKAARYPKGLCEAICRGLIKEQEWREDGVQKLMALKVTDRVERGEHHEAEDIGYAWDDITGETLEMKEVMKARKQEMTYVREKRVWTKIPRALAIRNGWKIIQTRWLDINKGDHENPNYRSRFVGKEFNNGASDGLFAATPPLEAVRLLISELATKDNQETDMVLMINDVARAFFEAYTERDLCIELPPEDREEGDGDVVGKLWKSLYGTRDAAANFQKRVKRVMVRLGFKIGRYNPCTFWHKERKIKTIVHGDDFITKAKRGDAAWFKTKLEEKFEIKTKIVGTRPEDSKEERVLNRVVRVTSRGWEYEADQRHVDVLVKAMKLENAKPVATPCEEEKPWKKEEEDRLLSSEDAREFRSLAARANYLALDRSDIQFATKEVCRGMANPTRRDHGKLKRLVRYLKGRPRVVTRFDWQPRQVKIKTHSDADWAGCKRTAKSTSGGAIFVGAHCVKTWASTQKGVTLSSGESELVAAVKASAETIGMMQLAQDWGLDYEGEIFVDSSAALGVVKRRGNGKLRHIRVGLLWVQEREENGDLKYKKIDGQYNTADMMTKGVPPKILNKHMMDLGMMILEGRATMGLALER